MNLLRFRRIIRSPWWPTLLSALVAPGVGQFVNRDIKKGVFLLAASVGGLLWFSKIITEQLARFLSSPPEQWLEAPQALQEAELKLIQENPGAFLSFFLLMLAIWLFGVLDAYLSAKSRLKKRSHETDHVAD